MSFDEQPDGDPHGECAAEIHSLTEERDKLRAELNESNDLLLSCALQFLMVDDAGIITHSYMSTEEELCRVLVKRGILREVSPETFEVVK